MNLTVWCQELVTIPTSRVGVLIGLALLALPSGKTMAKDVFPFPATNRTLENG